MTTPARPHLDQHPPVSVLRRDLRESVNRSLDRNLVQSSKWAAQLLTSLPPDRPDLAHSDEEPSHVVVERGPQLGFDFRTSTPLRHPTVAGLSNLHPSPVPLPGPHPPPPKHRRRERPRDSIGSVVSFGPASSPAAPARGDDEARTAADADDSAMDPDDDDDERSRLGRASSRKRRAWLARDEAEQDVHLVALSFVRSHELLRAVHALRRCKGPRARFLRCYAKFLAGEKAAIEESGDPLSQKDLKPPRNEHSQALLQEMAGWEPGFVDSDGYLLYLKALLLLSLPPVPPSASTKSRPPAASSSSSSSRFDPVDSTRQGTISDDLRLLALDTLVKSVELEPWNWSAWTKIASCLEGPEELETTLSFLPSGYPLLFFYVHCTLEIHSAGDSLHDVLDELEQVFPGPPRHRARTRSGKGQVQDGRISEEEEGEEDEEDEEDDEDAMSGELDGTATNGCSIIKGLRALVYYHVREFDESSATFSSIRRTDPYRIDDVDVLSNILYVSEKRAELSMLAVEYAKLDRTRPEVCCLVGNYYSLRRDHEKAIVYFRRALRLDRGYLSAWTLMGHEYIEIKNTNAAIASYRRAVDVNRKDYRAWYGLGQTYELLSEPFYALNYYRRATGLRPYDPRMWTALANCYEKLRRIPDAIQCYQRALVASDPPSGDVELLLRIGRLYASLPSSSSSSSSSSGLADSDRAAAYYRRALVEGTNQGMSTGELAKVYVWLAKWEISKSRVALSTTTGGRDGAGRGGGDLELAEEYLRKVEATQEGRDEAKGLLKELEVLMLSRE